MKKDKSKKLDNCERCRVQYQQKPTSIMEDNNLPTIHRFITDHNEEGKAIFNKDIEEKLDWQRLKEGARFGFGYATNESPVELSNGKDLETYRGYRDNLPGIMIPGGTVLRFVDMPPGATSPMHRTVSLDYGVVLEGTVDLVLDSNEVRTMKRGDVAIQRGTNHEWKNGSSTEWARMMYVLQESKPITIAGKELGEDYGGMTGVRPST